MRDRQLLTEIVRVHCDRNLGRGLYGARKVWHQLKREGHQVPRCQVERLMGTAGLRGARRGSKPVSTTRADPLAVRPPDLVDRVFRADRPNQLWVVDFTYVATWSGMAFTAFVTDVFSRRLVGWRCHASMPTALPLDALEMALWTRQRTGKDVTGLIHHATPAASTPPSATATGSPTPARSPSAAVGDSYDNALAETVVGLYKTECVRHDGPFRGVHDLELATLSWVHWFNTDRLHSSIGNIPPIEYENNHYRQTAALTEDNAALPSLH